MSEKMLILWVLSGFVTGFGTTGDTLRLDAVELVGGHEIAGSASHQVSHHGYHYWFATAKNKAAFAADPGRYEIQLGGACARMGALSGRGKAEIFAVHEGRLYLFASEACRKTFLSDPENLLNRPDPVPAGTEAEKARGRELLGIALQAIGGAERVDRLRSFRDKVVRLREGGAETVTVRTVAFPDRIRRDYHQGDYHSGMVATPVHAWFIRDGKPETMHASQRKALEERFYRDPLMILKARQQPGFQALAQGAGTLGRVAVERVAVSFDGMTTVLSIDPVSGHILAASYRGRGPRLFLGRVDRTFSDFQTRDGLTLPMAVSFHFEGEEIPDRAFRYASVEVDRDYRDLFTP